jgi:uncharacterized protein (UPF0305 family)
MMIKNDFSTRLDNAIRYMEAARTKRDLGEFIAREISRYTVHELQLIGGKMKLEVDKLPQPYREKVRPYFEKQIFGMYHRLLTMQRSGKMVNLGEGITDRETFDKFVEMIRSGCFGEPDNSGTDFYFEDPLNSFFYYLVSGFAMFVLDEPGHPVGTPFPGGFEVEKRGSEYFCPIRDKEEEVLFSICNFCPAKQMEGV